MRLCVIKISVPSMSIESYRGGRSAQAFVRTNKKKNEKKAFFYYIMVILLNITNYENFFTVNL